MRLLLPAALVVVALTGREATANPCYPWNPGGGLFEVTTDPEGGTVPTNARFRVTYEFNLISIPYRLALLDDAGAAVEVDVEEGPGSGESVYRYSSSSYFLTPRSPLAASSRYTLVDSLRGGWCGDPAPGGVCEGEPHTLATFQTGPGPDTAPPTSTRATVDTSYAAPSYDSCRDRGSVWHSVTVEGVADEQPMSTLRFNVYDTEGRLLRRQVRRPAYGHVCSDEPDDDDVDELVVRAVDVAGNEEVEGHRVRGRTCASYEGGCSAAGGGDLLAGGGGLALLLALRRRQSRRSRSSASA
jgi:hypothetical protein